MTPATSQAEKPQVVRMYVIAALTAQGEFWRQVERVRSGEPAIEVARAYGRVERAQVIAPLLDSFAAVGPATTERKRSIAIQRAGATAWTTPDETSGPRGTYAYRPGFRAVIELGAECIARLGVGRCLACSTTLTRDARASRR